MTNEERAYVAAAGSTEAAASMEEEVALGPVVGNPMAEVEERIEGAEVEERMEGAEVEERIEGAEVEERMEGAEVEERIDPETEAEGRMEGGGGGGGPAKGQGKGWRGIPGDFTRADMRQLLKARNLPVWGTRAELRRRLSQEGVL